MKPTKLPKTRYIIRLEHHQEFVKDRVRGFWRRSAVGSWMVAFSKQFYASISKSDYRALRAGFIIRHCPTHPEFDFHKYMLRAVESDFKRVVGISWYLWLFVVIFLLLNVNGWHTYFWLSFLPLVLLLTVGAKLDHIITRLAQDVADELGDEVEGTPKVRPSDEHFWFGHPGAVLYLIHFILFQNSFEIAFFFWIWTTYGFDSCIMESIGYLIPRLAFGVIIQVLCSYSTLPLYAIVTQMGDSFKESVFAEHLQSYLRGWITSAQRPKKDKNPAITQPSTLGTLGQKRNRDPGVSAMEIGMPRPVAHECTESSRDVWLRMADLEGTITSMPAKLLGENDQRLD